MSKIKTAKAVIQTIEDAGKKLKKLQDLKAKTKNLKKAAELEKDMIRAREENRKAIAREKRKALEKRADKVMKRRIRETKEMRKDLDLGNYANVEATKAFNEKADAAKFVGSSSTIKKARGGLIKGKGKKKRNANIDYRKSGMFYVGGMSAKPTKINKGKK